MKAHDLHPCASIAVASDSVFWNRSVTGMPVYFIGHHGAEGVLIKIGVAKDIQRRRSALQTGNAKPLEVMGWLETNDDFAVERSLHLMFEARRELGEWFNIDPSELVPLLKKAGRHGFVAKNADAFEVIGYDKDAIPEYLGIWQWADLDFEECCPFCGCCCGMHYQDASSMYHCLSCDTLTDFSEPSPPCEGDW